MFLKAVPSSAVRYLGWGGGGRSYRAEGTTLARRFVHVIWGPGPIPEFLWGCLPLSGPAHPLTMTCTALYGAFPGEEDATKESTQTGGAGPDAIPLTFPLHDAS